MSTSGAVQGQAAIVLAGACCVPLLREPITASQAADLARLALAAPLGCGWSRWSRPTLACRLSADIAAIAADLAGARDPASTDEIRDAISVVTHDRARF